MEGEVSVDHVPSEKDKLSPVRNYSDETFCSESSDGNQSNRSKNNVLLEKRRKTCTAAPGNPYRASASNLGARYVLLNANSKGNMNSIAQKVLSARMLRLKQLQNELNDAHFQINELATENRMLRTLQKRQDLALKRFEDKKADLPVLLNAHTEEVRTLRATIKQLRAQVREMEAKMKDRDTELTLLRERCSTLTDLCNNKQLEERDVLQKRVEELTKLNEEQTERIKLLNRKVALESKNYEHRLKTETTNHRNTQRELARVLENAAQLQTALDEKEKFIRSKIYPTSNNRRRNETGIASVSSFSHCSAAQSRFPELQKGDQFQGSGKGSGYFSEESSHNRSHSTRFSLVQDQVTPQSSDEKLDQLQITGTKKLNAATPCYSLKQQKYGRRHQDHQTILEDPDSDSQQTIVSSGGELFDDVGEREEHTVTTDELSRVSSPLEQHNSDQSKEFSDNVSEKPLKFVSSLHTPKSYSSSPVTSQLIDNSLKNCSDNIIQTSHNNGNINDTAHTHFNDTSASSNSHSHSNSSEEHSVEENNFVRSPSLAEITCSGESETVQQPCNSIERPKRVSKNTVIKEENVEINIKQHAPIKEEEKQSTFRKGELLAALEAIDKGKDVHTDVGVEDTEIDIDRAKNKTNLMRELFGSS
ncbi:lebercilin isoform X1 [Schistocerca piceifrons]|uniref:lebercilin isoform X1 n=1 Tax=Schistocerca piceifrons TaxID=274613 RepID=UPI001F5F16AC|nr:lebercilin isoform X1 [Schistocerca piceifrons]XP_047097563.1 lebercilin isoform X1 [Schistocerca piceifrons]